MVGCSGPSVEPAGGGASSASAPTRDQAKDSSENLEKISVAIDNFQAEKRTYPLQAMKTKDGGPGLSWRVALLPQLGDEALYKEFHLDEAWDSPHNKTLAAKMPAVYKSPMGRAGEGLTNYLAVVSAATVINPDTPVKIAAVSDGTANTIVVVEADDDRAVPWTKPADFDAEASTLDGLGGLHPKSAFLALTVSGEQHFMSAGIPAEVFKKFCTREGSEAVDWEAVKPR
jgi:hypothetical protein